MELIKGETLSCGCLRSSYGEKRIEQLLNNLNLTYIKEFSFPDLISEHGVALRFDFAVYLPTGKMVLIEYDGEQHYLTKTEKIWKDSLVKRQERD